MNAPGSDAPEGSQHQARANERGTGRAIEPTHARTPAQPGREPGAAAAWLVSVGARHGMLAGGIVVGAGFLFLWQWALRREQRARGHASQLASMHLILHPGVALHEAIDRSHICGLR